VNNSELVKTESSENHVVCFVLTGAITENVDMEGESLEPNSDLDSLIRSQEQQRILLETLQTQEQV